MPPPSSTKPVAATESPPPPLTSSSSSTTAADAASTSSTTAAASPTTTTSAFASAAIAPPPQPPTGQAASWLLTATPASPSSTPSSPQSSSLSASPPSYTPPPPQSQRTAPPSSFSQPPPSRQQPSQQEQGAEARAATANHRRRPSRRHHRQQLQQQEQVPESSTSRPPTASAPAERTVRIGRPPLNSVHFTLKHEDLPRALRTANVHPQLPRFLYGWRTLIVIGAVLASVWVVFAVTVTHFYRGPLPPVQLSSVPFLASTASSDAYSTFVPDSDGQSLYQLVQPNSNSPFALVRRINVALLPDFVTADSFNQNTAGTIFYCNTNRSWPFVVGDFYGEWKGSVPGSSPSRLTLCNLADASAAPNTFNITLPNFTNQTADTAAALRSNPSDSTSPVSNFTLFIIQFPSSLVQLTVDVTNGTSRQVDSFDLGRVSNSSCAIHLPPGATLAAGNHIVSVACFDTNTNPGLVIKTFPFAPGTGWGTSGPPSSFLTYTATSAEFPHLVLNNPTYAIALAPPSIFAFVGGSTGLIVLPVLANQKGQTDGSVSSSISQFPSIPLPGASQASDATTQRYLAVTPDSRFLVATYDQQTTTNFYTRNAVFQIPGTAAAATPRRDDVLELGGLSFSPVLNVFAHANSVWALTGYVGLYSVSL